MDTLALRRLLAPRSVALIGGAWTDAVAAASRAIGYDGEIWRVHPSRESTAQQHYFRSVGDLPSAPDASFIAAPNREVPAIAAALSARGGGGFVCFAAGFSESATAEGDRLTRQLLDSAGELPFFGPNCYGFVNFFDRVALWPDQLVGRAQRRGVALICQSGTIALDLLFNQRSLPIGYVITVGNQTRLAAEDMLELLAADERVSAFGLYLEGIQDIDAFGRAVECAHAAGKPVALIKAGRTESAARTARSHTGALSGSDVVFDAYCRQTGIARCDTLATLCETLKLLHTGGPLPGRRVLMMGASGGDMAMTADAARSLSLEFPPIPMDSTAQLRAALTDKVTISNPFDFHTHAWFDYPVLRAMFSTIHRAGYDGVGFLLDCPPEGKADATAYERVIEQFLATYPGPPARAALISSLPESLGAAVREHCLSAGVAPLQGQREALEAFDHAAAIGAAWQRRGAVQLRRPPQAVHAGAPLRSLTETEGKAALAAFGVQVPSARIVRAAATGLASAVAAAAEEVGYPVVIKAVAAELEHKSDVGAVILNVRTPEEAVAAAARLATLADCLLVEAMVVDGVAEVLIGVNVDAQFGQTLVIGAGGVLTELLRDTVTLLPPFTAAAITSALDRLRLGRLLRGYRGRPPGDVAALVDTALACARYAESTLTMLKELDINPVIVRPAGLGAVAVDVLIRQTS